MRLNREDGYVDVFDVLGIAAVIIVIIGLISLMVMWPFDKTPKDKIGLSYGGGVFEGAHFQAIKQPGSGLFFNGWGDSLYLYPTTQRNYIISKNQGEGDVNGIDFVSAPSQDRINVDYQVAVYFKLNLSLIEQFHENIGLKYQAWTEDGWNHMLADSFRQQIEYALQRESRKYDVQDIYANPTTLSTIQNDVGSVLKENVNQILGANYFCGPTYTLVHPNVCPDFEFIIKQISIPGSVQQAFQANRTSQIQIDTEKNQVTQAKYQAQSIKKVSNALKNASAQYTLLRAIESGKVTFWVIPENGNLTLPTPNKG